MIILLTESPLNLECANQLYTFNKIKETCIYPDLSFEKSKDETALYIVDVDDEYHLVKKISPLIFSTQLVMRGMPDTISDIYLITPDNNEASLISYANELSLYFSKYHHRKIAIHVPSQLGYDYTLISPSTESHPWQIYGIDGYDFNKSLYDHSNESIDLNLLKLKNKKLLWEGEDIVSYLNKPQQIFTGVSYVWSSDL